MAKVRVAILGTVGKSVLIDTGLEPRVTAIEEFLATLQSGAAASRYHKNLLGLQVGNDHPQYPMKAARETITGQWDFTQQIWAKQGTEALPGYAFTGATDTGMWASVLAGDPYFPLVTALLHMDGVNGGVSFPDSSSYGRTVTVTADAVTDTGTKKYGTASAKFPADAASRLDFGGTELGATDDWTMEFWLYRTNGAPFFVTKGTRFSFITPFSLAFSGGNGVQLNITDNTGSGVVTLTSVTAVPHDDWTFIAIQRSGSTFTMYQDGIATVTATYSGSIATNNTDPWRIGPNTGGGNEVWVDDYRLTVGVARYSSNFTPPTAAFPNNGSEVLLAFSMGGDEKFRIGADGQWGIGGANFGTLRQSYLSGGGLAAPTWSTLVHTDISDWDEAVQDVVGVMFVDSTTIDFTYDDTAGTETADVNQTANYTWSGNHDFSGLLTTDEVFLDNAAAAFISNNARPAIYSTNALGAPSTIFEFEGHLIIQPQTSAARDIILAAGSTTPQALVRVGDPFGTPYVWLPVNSTRLEFGASANTQMYTDGTNFFFENTAGALGFIGANTVKFSTSTANNIEFYINSSFAWGINGTGKHLFNSADNVEIKLGASDDLRLYHDGTNSYIENDTGELRIYAPNKTGTTRNSNVVGSYRVQGSARDVLVQLSDNVSFAAAFGMLSGELYFVTGNTYRGGWQAGGNLRLALDNQELEIGDGQDLRLYHDGTNSIIRNDTGFLNLQNGTSLNARFRSDVGLGLSLFGFLSFGNPISPAQIVANQNDYNPTGLDSTCMLRLNSDASRDITGLVTANINGRWLTIYNVGAQNIVLKNASGSSTAAYRFNLKADITIAPAGGVMLQYDSTVQNWRCCATY